MLSTKDLVFKERLVKKLTERYVGLYKITEVVCYIQVHPSRNYISMVISPLNYTSLPFMVAIFS